MHIIDFIRENEDWEEDLAYKPYCITTKHDDGYIILSYSQIDSDFNNSMESHYYNHANVGAYETLFYFNDLNVYKKKIFLTIVVLINYHMRLFNETEKESLKKFINDDELMMMLEKLHEADIE